MLVHPLNIRALLQNLLFNEGLVFNPAFQRLLLLSCLCLRALLARLIDGRR